MTRSIKFVSPSQASEITSLSPRQLDRLSREGRFPKTVRLGDGRNGRKAYVEHEIYAWNAARLAERDGEAA